RTLPFLWQQAARAPRVLPPIPLLNAPGTFTLTQRQSLCILANAFFCTFRDRPGQPRGRGSDLPSINFEELYGGPGWGTVEVAKLRMLFHYFEQCRQRDGRGDPLARPLNTIRRKAEYANAARWRQSPRPLLPPVVYPLGTSLDEAT